MSLSECRDATYKSEVGAIEAFFVISVVPHPFEIIFQHIDESSVLSWIIGWIDFHQNGYDEMHDEVVILYSKTVTSQAFLIPCILFSFASNIHSCDLIFKHIEVSLFRIYFN